MKSILISLLRALAAPTPEAFEELFTRNRWPAAWRDGVFPFHHYHSNSHEALGVYAGEVTVQFGGEAGVTLTAKPGDAIVLPAGTAHKRLSSRGTLGIVGAYPKGSRPDTCMGQPRDPSRIALPSCDPVMGTGGALFEHWK